MFSKVSVEENLCSPDTDVYNIGLPLLQSVSQDIYVQLSALTSPNEKLLRGWGRNIVDKVCRVTVLLQDSSKMVNFLLKIVLLADDLSGPVVETSHHTSLHVGRRVLDLAP